MLVGLRCSSHFKSRGNYFSAREARGPFANKAELDEAIFAAAIATESISVITRLVNNDRIATFIFTF